MTGRSTPSHRLERGAVRCKAPAEAGEGARELWGGNAPTAPAVTGTERGASQEAPNSGGTTDKEARSRREQQAKTRNGANGLPARRAASRLAQLERLRLRREQTERDNCSP